MEAVRRGTELEEGRGKGRDATPGRGREGGREGGRAHEEKEEDEREVLPVAEEEKEDEQEEKMCADILVSSSPFSISRPFRPPSLLAH